MARKNPESIEPSKEPMTEDEYKTALDRIWGNYLPPEFHEFAFNWFQDVENSEYEDYLETAEEMAKDLAKAIKAHKKASKSCKVKGSSMILCVDNTGGETEWSIRPDKP